MSDTYVEIFHCENDNESEDYYEVNLFGSTEYDGDTFDELIAAESYAEEIASALNCKIVYR